ncbi:MULTISPECIES: hypothetical protein [Methanobacterium]|uniref:DUF7583 domain-containing protein n=1 Tax=Methanobacterium bryantii TaxID=2161 RepID=A0A2A2H906_METBR|nr:MULTISPECIES: hypothetical protein [Methanobacterium]OEC87876.1 hypothetical protein A9507_06790 [Methanobacterium sp. A39]PAV05743.1 hypothetical protein ASJ80_08400 [Methanobacterium bryantii]
MDGKQPIKTEAIPYTGNNPNIIPICPLHTRTENKLDAILDEVKKLQIDDAKKEGKEEAETKISDNKMTFRNQIKFILIGAFLTFIFIILSKLLEYFTPL